MQAIRVANPVPIGTGKKDFIWHENIFWIFGRFLLQMSISMVESKHKKEGKKMKNVKMKMLQTIANLQTEMNHYRELEQFGKVAEIRLEIARLQAIIGETY